MNETVKSKMLKKQNFISCKRFHTAGFVDKRMSSLKKLKFIHSTKGKDYVG